MGPRRRTAAATFVVAGLILVFTVVAAPAAAQDEPAPLRPGDQITELHVGRAIYKKVTVDSVTATHVYIRHAGGIAGLPKSGIGSFEEKDVTRAPKRSDDLADRVTNIDGFKVQLGGESPEEVMARFKHLEDTKASNLEKMQAVAGLATAVLAQQDVPIGQFAWQFAKMAAGMLAIFFLIAIPFYLLSCWIHLLICRKAGHEPGPLIWVPFLQLIPLLRAAGMSVGWFTGGVVLTVLGIATSLLASPQTAGAFGIFQALYNLTAWLIWCVAICRARGKGGWCMFFLIFPLTNFFAILYLAFSD